ncbi:antitoxin Xre/MbcA/ParS toxin-binding domain-containing protein [Roseateles cellulosilyticus]|uniref:MbcA/ParS/Xre antitoxin family protein n=1 Tax=Pelomonas cellulosilytica TaxID=2906762 RepID=A0ABS8XZQ0_9BURK|nr:MbcA/ParS/Xre antitoxin family protein [Pelomonas sp. P8]
MKVPTQAKATLLRKLGQMIEGSGGSRDDVALSDWLDAWFTEPLPELNGATPSELLFTEDGLERVEVLLERMSGGLSA